MNTTSLIRYSAIAAALSLVALTSTATSAGASPSRPWHWNTWNETQSGVVHAYFPVPPNHSHMARAALLKVRTPQSKLRLTCQLRLGGRRPASSPYSTTGHKHAVSFPLPSPLRRKVRATAICHTPARIDTAWMSLGPAGDDLGRYHWTKLRRT